MFLRGLALLDAPVPLPVFALYLLPYGSPVSDKGCNQSINQYWYVVQRTVVQLVCLLPGPAPFPVPLWPPVGIPSKTVALV